MGTFTFELLIPSVTHIFQQNNLRNLEKKNV